MNKINKMNELNNVVPHNCYSLRNARKLICVVGNRFSVFSENENVYTLDAFWELTQKYINEPHNKMSYQVALGQGLGDKAIQKLVDFFDSQENNNRFQCDSSLLLIRKASSWMTHKYRQENILISAPHKVSESFYESYLMSDDQCAEMQDHMTGEHLQAMLLIEAARQMMTATAESHWLIDEFRGTKNFVLDSFSSEFMQYLFPLDVTLQLSVTSFRKGLNGNFKANVCIDFIQIDQVMMRCHGVFSAMEKNSLTQLEKSLAIKCLEQSMNVSSVITKAA